MRATQIALVVLLTALAIPFVVRTPDRIDADPYKQMLTSREPTKQLRRPVSLAVVDGGRTLLVANQRSGTISVVDLESERVVGEKEIGGQPADLVVDSREKTLYVVDRETNALIILQRRRGALQEIGRVNVDAAPVSVLLNGDDTRVTVASLWAHRLCEIDVSDPQNPKVVSKIDLPFSPREQRELDDGRLVVADAFGGHLGIIDVQQQQLVAHRELHAHNMRGLGLSLDRKSLYIPHQSLMSDSPTTQGGVHWGAVLMNLIQTISLNSLSTETIPFASRIAYLGDENNATGDPTDILVAHNDRRIVAYAGTSEIAISDPGTFKFTRVSVGRRPTALALDPDQNRVYVANTLDDSISVVDVETATALSKISLGPAPALSLVDRGELLFYDAHLSSDQWFSCNSCHVDGHSNGFLNDNFGDDTTGAPKRVLSLLGVSQTQPWSWTGNVHDLAQQVRKSVSTTMRGPELEDDQVQALTAFIETLSPPPSIRKARSEVDSPGLVRGQSLFNELGCSHCHMPRGYTSRGTYDVNIPDENGQREFNPPSLLGISQRQNLFHDNRAEDLRAVFEEFSHGLDEPLSNGDLTALVSFLESL